MMQNKNFQKAGENLEKHDSSKFTNKSEHLVVGQGLVAPRANLTPNCKEDKFT